MIWWLKNKDSYIFTSFWNTYLVANRFVNKLTYGKTREITLSQIAHCALQSAQISAPKSSVTFTVSFQLSFHHPSFHEWYVLVIDRSWPLSGIFLRLKSFIGGAADSFDNTDMNLFTRLCTLYPRLYVLWQYGLWNFQVG